MAWFLFIDESGHDRREAPYEVLAGVAVRDRDLWSLVLAMHDAEVRYFGRRYSTGTAELKGKKLLKKKVFQHAQLNCQVPPPQAVALAKAALDDGAAATLVQLRALAGAKLDYVEAVFRLCSDRRCRAFASIVEPTAPSTGTDGLRKDYAYLLQRFFYFLETDGQREQGIVVFDEFEKSRSHLLIDQMQRYFSHFAVGRHRSSLIVPEPLFVHSDLTTGIQLADLVAYCLSWGYRNQPRLQRPRRDELARYDELIDALQHHSTQTVDGRPLRISSFAHISDLRTRSEREAEGLSQ